ncbi:MAG: cation:proton antiporter [Methanolinea sp.]|jgi:Kef-type K+ transport system membrane component KefB|nr:cation:proton antiporter [Methanolinea sp.]
MDPLPALLVVLVVAKVLGELVERAGFPALVGEIAAGALLGPALLGIVRMDDTIGTFADIGLIVLLFTSGLQLNMRSFRNSIRTGFSVALWGVIIPLLGGTAAGLVFGFSYIESLVIGVTLSITSIGVSVRSLIDLNQLKTDAGLAIVSAAVIDDAIGIVLLGSLSALALGEGRVNNILVLLFLAALFIGLLLTVGRRAIVWAFKISQKAHTHEMSYSMALVLGLLAAVLSNWAGLHYAIGAFLAGLVLGDSIRSDQTLYDSLFDLAFGFFVTIFFASIGLLFPSDISRFSIILLAALFFIALGTKTAGGLAGALPAFRNYKKSFLVGLGLCPRGEVALVVVKVSLAAGILSASLFSTLTVVIIATVLVTPFLLAWGFSLPGTGQETPSPAR